MFGPTINNLLSGDSIGWLAAIVSIVSFGSFGVPMKNEASTSVDVDPLVFQSYKTVMCFLSSFLVILFGIKPSFTPWGLVSGLFWVPAGTAGIYAVRRAGLAISVGIWSSVIVIVRMRLLCKMPTQPQFLLLILLLPDVLLLGYICFSRKSSKFTRCMFCRGSFDRRIIWDEYIFACRGK
mmetsp:Transcript_5124/g.6961  ORF Transcript_5124/g.6961 Transcript_5124/m.6961 type:complete len:180 (+) Transcript_5124:22-561(+)